MLGEARRLRDTIAQALNRGALVVVTSPPATPWGVHTHQEIQPFHLLEILPGSWPPPQPLLAPSPEGLQCPAGEPFRSFIHQTAALFEPDAALDLDAGQVIAATRKDGVPVGIYTYRHPGGLMILPALVPDIGADRLALLLQATIRLARRLGRHGLPQLPDWAEDEPPARLRQLENDVADLQQRLAMLRKELAATEAAVQTVQRARALAAGPPDSALPALSHALLAMGLAPLGLAEQHEGVAVEAADVLLALLPVTRADEDPESICTRAIRHARTVAAERGAGAWPMLVHVAENLLPIEERTGPPAPLRALAAARGIAVVDGAHLLEILLAGDQPGLIALTRIPSGPRSLAR